MVENIQQNQELVSIITPAYNCASTIVDTIESVIAQTYLNWEMIIVNDCSTDDTALLVYAYTKKDSRIKLVNLDTNSGSYAARNVAIEMANGRYIALLDADDLWKPHKLEVQIKFMREYDIAFSFTAYEIFNGNDDKIRKLIKVPQKIGYRQYLHNTIIGCLTVVIDKYYIPDFHMEKGYLEDILTWMHYLRKGIYAYGINVNLASYRRSVRSKSSNKFNNARRYYACLKLQHLNVADRLFCQIGYIYNALKKRVFAKRLKYDK